jgi:hypothetical protein
MTTLLEHAFAKAAKLTAAEQDVLASRLLAELGDEDDIPEEVMDGRSCLHRDHDTQFLPHDAHGR